MTASEAGTETHRERAAHLGPERRRPLILDAALRLFVDHGYLGTSMDAIAAAGGVTKPVVYDCFPSKSELFKSLLEREEARLLEAVAATLPTEVDFNEVEQLLTDGFTSLLRAAEAAPDSWRVLFLSEHGADPAIVRRVRRSRGAVVSQISSMIEPYLRTLDVADAQRKAPVLAELLTSVGEAGVRVFLDADGEWAPDELGSMFGRVIAHGPAAA